jgi:hypothetical protein
MLGQLAIEKTEGYDVERGQFDCSDVKDNSMSI